MALYVNQQLQGVGIPESAVGSPLGVASLDASGVHEASQVSELARNRVYVVADEAERLGLSVEEGHECIQLDDASQWIYDDVVGWIERAGGGGVVDDTVMADTSTAPPVDVRLFGGVVGACL